MKNLNQENIDELMFMLLEGEITGEERAHLLEAINADPEYSKMWAAWQNTIVSPADDIPQFNPEKLKKKTRPVFAVHIRRYAVAAAVVLACFLALHFINTAGSDPETDFAGTAPIRPNKPVIKTPEQNDRITKNPLLPEKDTFISKSEIIKNLARINTPTTNQKFTKSVEIPLPQEAPDNNDEFIVSEQQHPKMETKPLETPVKPVLASNDDIEVTIETTKLPNAKNTTVKENNDNLLSRLFGGSKIKLENDSNTRTNRKLIIENKKYQIIAGF